MSETEILHGLIGCLDLTNLEENCDSAAITALCEKARTPQGNVAAVCIQPRFVAEAKALLAGTGIKIASVVNFPDGGEDTCALEAETQQALADGADEIELVIPCKVLAEGRPGFVETQIVRIKRICGDRVLKAVLETGALPDSDTIAKAADIALGAGADFLKTSSATVASSNPPNRADILLTAIAEHAEQNGAVGFEAAGEIQTPDDAVACFQTARRIRGDATPNPDHFRIGAGDLLDTLIAALEGKQPKQVSGARS